jgi:hypothetical protein
MRSYFFGTPNNLEPQNVFFFPFHDFRDSFFVPAKLQVSQILIYKELFDDRGGCISGKQSLN